MSIEDAIKSGKLPNINVNVLLSICKRVGIPASDLKYNLSNEQLLRLQFEPGIHKQSVNSQIKIYHNNLLSNYDRMISKYEMLSKRMDSDPNLSSRKGEIDTLISNLKTARENYNKVIDNISLGKNNIGFDSRVINPMDKVILNETSAKISREGSMLRNEYAKLDKLKSNNFKTKFKQRKNENKIQKVCNRIEKLQSKQGKLQTRQQKIVNKGSLKYEKIRTKEFNKYLLDLQRYDAYANAVVANMNAQSNYSHDLSETKKELSALQGKNGIKNAINRVKLQSDIRSLSKDLEKYKRQAQRLDKLRDKRSMCKFSEQFYRQVTMSYAM